ncbi:MAG: P-loop NTPase, partial [Candidatus Onthovivens sp.]
VAWGKLDVLLIDMPPGTGDVTLTAFQSIPLDGIIIVTSPQDLVSLIVKKAINMAKMMNIPILGMVENMSYVECPDCHRKIEIYGKSRLDDLSKSTGIEILGRLPIKEGVSTLVDSGNVECVELNEIYGAVEKIKGLGI